MKAHVAIPIAYSLFGVTWIMATDVIVEAIAPSVSALTLYQTAKGWFYVVMSSLLLYWLMRLNLQRRREQQAEREALYRKTVEGAHHILRNYLNQMQLVTLEAERCADFDAETLKIAHEASENATAALVQLEQLHRPTTESLHDVLYPPRGDAGGGR